MLIDSLPYGYHTDYVDRSAKSCKLKLIKQYYNTSLFSFFILPSIFVHQHVRECVGVSGSVWEGAGVCVHERG